MQRLFGKSKPNTAKSPATSVQSSSGRRRQERSYSDYERKSSGRPVSPPRSNTWSTREPSPKPPKSKSRFSNLFSKESDDEDDFFCVGEDGNDMLRKKRDSSSRQFQNRVASPNIPKSPYPDLSLDDSFTKPRPLHSVLERKRTESSGAISEIFPGRNGRNSHRVSERDKNVPSNSHGRDSSSRDRKRNSSRHRNDSCDGRNDSCNGSDNGSFRNERKPSSERKANLKPLAHKVEDKNGCAAGVSFDDRKLHIYDKVSMSPPKKHRRGHERGI